MTVLALALVLMSAVAHALWNLELKKAGGGVPFVWLFGGLASSLYFPVALGAYLTLRPSLRLPNLVAILASASVHTAYFTLLELGYRTGEMSVVYPVARGTGPLLSALFGIAFLKECPSALAAGGIVLMVTGLVALSGEEILRRSAHDRKALLFAVLCGLTISLYTVIDKVAVAVLGTPPLIHDWGTNLGRFLLLAPVALRRREAVLDQWRTHRKEAFRIAFLSPLAYILVLTAMTMTPVSYVAPAREVSILIGTAMGAKAFSEKRGPVRLAGSVAMVLGLMALALG